MPTGKPPRVGTALPTPHGLGGPAGIPTNDRLDRWAVLIADGRDRFPEGLPEADHARLLAAVHEQLRRRLLRLVAQAMAAHVHGRQQSEKEFEPC